MADWPDAEELGKVLNVSNDEANWTQTLERVMAAAIARVKGDVGAWDELVDEPDDNLAQAALRMAEMIAQRGEQPMRDPTYDELLRGRRRRFGFSTALPEET